jgi:hypothetical protein
MVARVVPQSARRRHAESRKPDLRGVVVRDPKPPSCCASICSASKNPLYLGPTRRRCESSRIGDRGADFSVEVPSLVNHESALPLYTGQ